MSDLSTTLKQEIGLPDGYDLVKADDSAITATVTLSELNITPGPGTGLRYRGLESNIDGNTVTGTMEDGSRFSIILRQGITKPGRFATVDTSSHGGLRAVR